MIITCFKDYDSLGLNLILKFSRDGHLFRICFHKKEILKRLSDISKISGCKRKNKSPREGKNV